MNPRIFAWAVYALWGAVVIYLTVAAIGVKREPETHLGQSFALMFALIAAWVLPRLPAFDVVNFTPPPALAAIGLVLAVVGSAFLVWGRAYLGTNWSQTVAAKEDHELVTTGPYAVVRNPMYAGGLLAALGSAIAVGGPFVYLLVILGGLFLWRVRAEDALMARQFPDAYPAYRRRTKALVPLVY